MGHLVCRSGVRGWKCSLSHWQEALFLECSKCRLLQKEKGKGVGRGRGREILIFLRLGFSLSHRSPADQGRELPVSRQDTKVPLLQESQDGAPDRVPSCDA